MSISTQPARRTIARPKGVLLPLALLMVAILAAFTLLPGLIAPHDPIALAMADRLKPPSLTHIFGTDEGGQRIELGPRQRDRFAIAAGQFPAREDQ